MISRRSFLGFIPLASLLPRILSGKVTKSAPPKVTWTHHCESKLFDTYVMGQWVVARSSRASSKTRDFENAMQHWQGKVNAVICKPS